MRCLVWCLAAGLGQLGAPEVGEFLRRLGMPAADRDAMLAKVGPGGASFAQLAAELRVLARLGDMRERPSSEDSEASEVTCLAKLKAAFKTGRAAGLTAAVVANAGDPRLVDALLTQRDATEPEPYGDNVRKEVEALVQALAAGSASTEATRAALRGASQALVTTLGQGNAPTALFAWTLATHAMHEAWAGTPENKYMTPFRFAHTKKVLLRAVTNMVQRFRYDTTELATIADALLDGPSTHDAMAAAAAEAFGQSLPGPLQGLILDALAPLTDDDKEALREPLIALLTLLDPIYLPPLSPAGPDPVWPARDKLERLVDRAKKLLATVEARKKSEPLACALARAVLADIADPAVRGRVQALVASPTTLPDGETNWLWLFGNLVAGAEASLLRPGALGDEDFKGVALAVVTQDVQRSGEVTTTKRKLEPPEAVAAVRACAALRILARAPAAADHRYTAADSEQARAVLRTVPPVLSGSKHAPTRLGALLWKHAPDETLAAAQAAAVARVGAWLRGPASDGADVAALRAQLDLGVEGWLLTDEGEAAVRTAQGESGPGVGQLLGADGAVAAVRACAAVRVLDRVPPYAEKREYTEAEEALARDLLKSTERYEGALAPLNGVLDDYRTRHRDP